MITILDLPDDFDFACLNLFVKGGSLSNPHMEAFIPNDTGKVLIRKDITGHFKSIYLPREGSKDHV